MCYPFSDVMTGPWRYQYSVLMPVCLSTGDDSMRMSHLKVGSAADIPLDIGELDLSQLTASLTTPSGREEPCLLKMLRNGHVGKCGYDIYCRSNCRNSKFFRSRFHLLSILIWTVCGKL